MEILNSIALVFGWMVIGGMVLATLFSIFICILVLWANYEDRNGPVV